MSRFSDFLFGTKSSLPSDVINGRPLGTDIVSPWADSSPLAKIAYSEIFHGGTDIVDRDAAMRVAPVKRGRAIIVGSIADLPLSAGRWNTDGTWKAVQRQPTWLTTTGGPSVETPWHRMANTVDDLIFSGWSLWFVARDANGSISDAMRVPPSAWAFDKNAALGIKVNDVAITDAKSVILFRGPDEGVLATGADIIRGARAIEQAWVGRVQSPIPAMVLQEIATNGGAGVTQAEAERYVEQWTKARTSPNGAVGFLPSKLEMHVFGEINADLFEGGRNAIRLDVANLLNLPASLLDGSTATASLTYVTTEGQRSQLIDFLEYWIAPIEARLSMDDVTPHGQVIRFDRSNLTDVPNDTHGPELGVTEEPQEAINV